MVRQADPTRFGFQIAVASMLLLLGVLNAFRLLRGDVVAGLLGLAAVPVAIAWLVLSVRGLQRERARRD